jgi:hypothetical protein
MMKKTIEKKAKSIIGEQELGGALLQCFTRQSTCLQGSWASPQGMKKLQRIRAYSKDQR